MQSTISISNTDTDSDIDAKFLQYAASVKRNAAFHEAGHAVVFIHTGASLCKCTLTFSLVSIPFEVEGRKESRTYENWGGNVESPPLLDSCRRLGSLSGFIASRIAKSLDNVESLSVASLASTFRDVTSKELSDSDRVEIGNLDDDELTTAMEESISILASQWPLVEKVAAVLIESNSVTLMKCGSTVLMVN